MQTMINQKMSQKINMINWIKISKILDKTGLVYGSFKYKYFLNRGLLLRKNNVTLKEIEEKIKVWNK